VTARVNTQPRSFRNTCLNRQKHNAKTNGIRILKTAHAQSHWSAVVVDSAPISRDKSKFRLSCGLKSLTSVNTRSYWLQFFSGSGNEALEARTVGGSKADHYEERAFANLMLNQFAGDYAVRSQI